MYNLARVNGAGTLIDNFQLKSVNFWYNGMALFESSLHSKCAMALNKVH